MVAVIFLLALVRFCAIINTSQSFKAGSVWSEVKQLSAHEAGDSKDIPPNSVRLRDRSSGENTQSSGVFCIRFAEAWPEESGETSRLRED